MAELPLEAFYDHAQLGELALSPSGDRLAFTVDEFVPDEDERVSGLFVVPTDGSRDPHRLTRAPGARSPKWGPDGDRLAFLAARETDDVARRIGRESDGREDGDEGSDAAEGDQGDEDDEDGPDEQVWLFDLSLGGDARRVTDREEGVREFDWSPDGDRIVVSARDPTEEEREYLARRREGGPIETERLQHKLDGVGWLDSVTSYLFVVDVATGAERRLDDAYGGGAYDGLSGMRPSWGAGGRIAFTSCRTERPDDTLVRDVYTVDADGGDLRRVTDKDLSATALAWGPDGERLAFAADDPVNWCIPTRLFVADDDGYAAVTADLDRTVARGATPVWADEGTLYVRVGDKGRTRLVRASVDGGAERVFEVQGETRALTAVDVAGDAAAVALSDPGKGHDAYALDAAALADPDASLRRLTDLNADFVDEHEMPACRRVSYESDGHEIDAVLYHPPSFDPDDPDPRPLVVAIHGGPISYDEPVFDFDHAALTSRGYVVLRPNYRGGSSYGRRFAETLRGRWGTVEVDDIAAGIEAAIERGWADADRVFGFGFSYGGIAQGYLVTQTDLLTAAAPEHGIYDLRSAYGTDDSHVWMENEYGLPWEVPNEIDASSSITDAGEISTPLLITAGGEDWRCPPSQSEQLYVAAKKAGVDARLLVFPDEHHNVGDPDRAIRRLSEITDWYERHDPAVGDD